jgi:serine/threonine-protein kinase
MHVEPAKPQRTAADSIPELITESRNPMHGPAITANAPADRATRFSSGDTLGPWRLLRLLGCGAWTQVFQAAPIDAIANASADYAIKMIKPAFASKPDVIAMLQREATISKDISHPHLTSILSAHISRPPLFLVMPFQPGATVADLIRANQRLTAAKALWIARQAAEGLSALHQCNWLHGDVKPENVFVAVNGHVTMCDLGFARQLVDGGDRPRSLCGTPAYLAPEILSGSIPVSASSDVYALGVMLFEMLTGSRPFTHADEDELAAAHRLLPPPDPRTAVPDLSPGVCRLLRRMLAKDPLRRPTGTELIELLVDLEIDVFNER